MPLCIHDSLTWSTGLRRSWRERQERETCLVCEILPRVTFYLVPYYGARVILIASLSLFLWDATEPFSSTFLGRATAGLLRPDLDISKSRFQERAALESLDRFLRNVALLPLPVTVVGSGNGWCFKLFGHSCPHLLQLMLSYSSV